MAWWIHELKKDDWELAVYPLEDHAFVQPASWADEYKRILKLFETSLRWAGTSVRLLLRILRGAASNSFTVDILFP